MTKEVEQGELLQVVKTRFEGNMHRHEGVLWSHVQDALLSRPGAMTSLQAMEATGGEPDVVAESASGGGLAFYDCAAESPSGRRSLCYDGAALASRKEHKPKGSAVEMAEAMGIVLLTEEQYRFLQRFEALDAKTSSWVQTPEEVRSLGGALFCDRRFGRVFVYHNGAESYYAARGFRARLAL